MSNVDFLNIEYLLVRAYEQLSNFQASAGSLPEWAFSLVMTIVFLGMAASFVLLILLVWAHIQLMAVEHRFHEQEHATVHPHPHKEPEVESTGKNERWERVVELSISPNQSDWRRAILEADIMLGVLLEAQGYPGESIGEQLKHANPIQMTTLDLAWKAHKVRNDVAHGGEGFELTEHDVRATIDYYKRVFEELGAI